MHVATELGLFFVMIIAGVGTILLIGFAVMDRAWHLLLFALSTAAISVLAVFGLIHMVSQDWQVEQAQCQAAGHGKPTYIQTERSGDLCFVQSPVGWTLAPNW